MSLVTLALAKEALQITHVHQDNYIQLILDSAEEYVHHLLGIYLQTDIDTEITEDLTVTHITGDKYLYPSKLPILNVVSITDREDSQDSEDWEEVDTDDYRWDSFKIFALGDEDQRWEQGDLRWRVKYTAGYDADTLPSKIKEFILQLVVRKYESRGSKSSGGAAGASFSWQDFVNSDMMRMLAPFNFGTRGVG